MKIVVQDLQIELVSYEDWLPIQGDLKTLSDEALGKLKKSFKRKGGFVPSFLWVPTTDGPTWHKGKKYLLDGHQRHTMFVKEKATFIHPDGTEDTKYPCVLVEAASLKDAKEKLLIISSQYGQVTNEGFAEFSADLDTDFLDNIPAITVPELATESKTNEYEGGEDDGYEEPDDLDIFVQEGDLISIGPHRLLCGDATKEESWAKLMEEERADLIVIDPPYNVDYTGKTKDALKIDNDKMEDGNFYQFLLDLFTSMKTICNPGAGIYVWHADSEGMNFRKAFMDAGFYLAQCLIWVKNNMVMGRQDYHWKHEPCQPAGTLVETPSGPIPIENLKTGDRVVSFNQPFGNLTGLRDGIPIKTATRIYDGKMYKIEADGRATEATDGHKFSVRFNADAKHKYCTYLMKRGDWWRVGITGMYNARGFGLKHRVRQEKAEASWILQTFETKREALVAEILLTCKYGIPQTHWEVERGFRERKYKARSEAMIESIYAGMDLYDLGTRAGQLLSDFGRSYKFPLIHTGNQGDKLSTRAISQIAACNIIPDVMTIPVQINYDKATNRNLKWEVISGVSFREFSGRVYSLEVEKYEHYIADGLITHNCLYGWSKPGSHKWYSDRKQTTVRQAAAERRASYNETNPAHCLPDRKQLGQGANRN